MPATLATKQTIGGRPVLRFERRLAHPPEKVWKAVTDPSEMSDWFPATVETELRVGAPMRFKMEEMDSPDGEIVELDPPKLFVFHWGADVLRWELLPEGDGCRLIFTHTMSGDLPFGDELASARNAAGWDVCLDDLSARIDGRATDEDRMDEWFELNERYVEEFGLAEGEVRDHPDGYLVRFERDLIQPVDQVWNTITEGADPAIGMPPPRRFANGYIDAGAVTETDPQRLLEYEWEHDGAPAGRVRWELSPQHYGSRLVLTQTLPTRLADLRATALAVWQTHLELFVAALHGPPRPWPDERTEELKQSYAERL